MNQTRDFVQAYCSIPDVILKHSEAAKWLQQKYGKINGPCYWHDEDDNEDLFLAKLNRGVDEMHISELQLLAKALNKASKLHKKQSKIIKKHIKEMKRGTRTSTK